MKLATQHPPGRANRKARSFHAEIQRLRAAGHTLNVIRQALHDAGLAVSLSTVWRESVKAPATGVSPARSSGSDQSPSAASAASAASNLKSVHGGSRLDQQMSPGSTSPSKAYVGDARTGMQIVEEFMRGRTTNPLLQERK